LLKADNDLPDGRQVIAGNFFEILPFYGKTLNVYPMPATLPTGLSRREKYFRENTIKGRIAETLIEELFLSLNYKVFRYGMENTIPGVMESLKRNKNDVSTNIRNMPDFVIQNPENHDVFFVEVKFRANEEFRYADLPKNYPYENALVVLISKKHIKCLSVEELRMGEEFTATCKNYLGNRKEFDLDKEVIKEFCHFATKFFDNV
jgi:hypothetical protein